MKWWTAFNDWLRKAHPSLYRSLQVEAPPTTRIWWKKGLVVLGEYNLDIQAFAKTYQAYQIVFSRIDEREIKSSVDLDQLLARLFPYSAV